MGDNGKVEPQAIEALSKDLPDACIEPADFDFNDPNLVYHRHTVAGTIDEYAKKLEG